MKKRVYLFTFLCLSFCFYQSYADVKLAHLFANHMVLQQDTTVKIWGWANPDESIKVKADWITKPMITKANAEGKWMIALKTLKYDKKHHSIIFKANNEIEINDILFGEVWLCGGQSNMSFPIKGVPGHYSGLANAADVLAKADYPNLRFITVKRNVAQLPKQDVEGDWQVCNPETAGGDISAVSYFFALQIIEKTGFPVGLIGSNWGGTPAESWMNKAVLENETNFKPILDRYNATVSDWKNINQQYLKDKKTYQYKDSIAKATKTNRPIAPPEPIGPNSNKSPYKLYNGMIVPLQSFVIKGVVWYQGENNAIRAYQYRKLFPALIQNWRDDWQNQNLPFYFVQISPHHSQNPEIRESQLLTFEHVKRTGMVVTTDNGDSLNIHPLNKKLVGNRLALWPLKNLYGFNDMVACGPIYQYQEIKGNKIILHFKYDDGLNAKGGSLKEFMLAGADEVFYPAKAEIIGKTILVSSSNVAQPVAVRFAWKNVPHPNLYNEAGLPASPFRTDTWVVATQGLN